MKLHAILTNFFDRVLSGGYTKKEMAIAAGGGDEETTTTRNLQPEEKELLKTQSENLSTLTRIAEMTYDLSKEDRDYFERVFREGSDTEAKEAIAKLKEKITGEPVDPETIKDVGIDSLLRDTILTATPEFQDAALKFTEANAQLAEKYGEDVTGLSKAFADTTRQYTSNYATEIKDIKDKVGTIDQDILSREKGAALGGISTAYDEARKQMQSDMARRGLAGTGVESQVMRDMYMQEAMSKGAAGVQARTTAYQQTQDALKSQAGLAGSALQGQMAGEQTAYGAEVGGIQNVYGVTSGQMLQDYNIQNASALQGIAALQQASAAGQGVYLGSQNYIGQSTTAAGTAAQSAGSTAAALDMSTTSRTDSSVGLDDIGNLASGIGGFATGMGYGK